MVLTASDRRTDSFHSEWPPQMEEHPCVGRDDHIPSFLSIDSTPRLTILPSFSLLSLRGLQSRLDSICSVS